MNTRLPGRFHFLLIIFACLAVAVRCYHLAAPLADWHSWRQSDTAAVARNFEKFGIDVLRPRYDDLSNIQSGKDNPNGYRMVEMPLYQLVGVYMHKAFPSLTIEVSLRLVSAVAAGLSVYLLGILAFSFLGAWEGLIAAFFYAFLPYAIYYGRTILPDTFAVFWALLSLVLLSREKMRSSMIVLGALSAAIAILVRPMTAFLLVPAVFLLSRKGISVRTLFWMGLYGAISIIPFIWWRGWIGQFPEGIPANDWLLNNNGIRFKGAWFHWLFAKRIAELILGYWGLILFGLGLAAKSKKNNTAFSFLWIVGILLYFIIFAGGNVQHDYYQALIVPVIVWFMAKGTAALLSPSAVFHRVGSWMLVGVTVLFSFAFSWYTVRTYYWINRPEIVEAGKDADAILPKDAKVIASYNGDTTFLYQTNRQGWPLGFDIAQKIAMGATHYVTVSPTDADGETRALASEYTVLVRNDRYAIIDLTKPNPAKLKK